MRKAIKNNKMSVVISFLLIAGFIIYYFCSQPYLLLENGEIDKEKLYNLLTVNTIFAGFLYNMLGNMVEFCTRDYIKELDEAGYINKYFSPMYFGIFYLLISIFLEIMILFFSISWNLNLLLYIQISSSMLGFIFFVISALKLRKMINKVRNKNQ